MVLNRSIEHSDEQLLVALKQGDENAFAEIFSRHWGKVYAIAYQKLRSQVLAEELVQDLFFTVWEKRNTLLINNLEPYLITSIKHRIISHIRSQVVERKYWDYYKNTFSHIESITEKDVEYNELVNALENGIDDLPEKSKQVFTLNRMQGRSVSEIATLLNVSEKAIEYHLTRSLKQLRLHLKDFILMLTLFFIS
jgi:RNA polymerase sigma-70 factor (family 1)